jgi:hypothetical protein
MMPITVLTSSFRAFILNLARQHGVSSARTPIDQWALVLTRLSYDDREAPDEIEQYAIILKRDGFITGREMGQLLVGYLQEKTEAFNRLGRESGGYPACREQASWR